MKLSQFEEKILKYSILKFLFIYSQSGKSSFMRQLLLERKIHFESNITQLVYIYKSEDKNIKSLKKNFGKSGTFLNEIPDELESLLLPKQSICVIDDFESSLVLNKQKIANLIYLANVAIHHKGLVLFLLFQSFSIFLRKHALHDILYQATQLILFRSMNSFSTLKRFLNSYEVKLKGQQTLYDIFKKFVQGEPYQYLIINIAPKLQNPT